MLFLGASLEKAHDLNEFLIWCEMISGLRVNISKSKIYGVGLVANLGEIASDLGCRVDIFPSTYLGLPLGAKCKSINI